MIECVPNVSEGRRQDTIDACASAIRRSGASLLDVSADPAHNRSVFTCVVDQQTALPAMLGLFDCAMASIDMRRHTGEHPRVGAVDVVPFVPFGGVTMSGCVSLARELGAAVAERHGVPVYLYEHASLPGKRRALEEIRRGGLSALVLRMQRPEWAPDFGLAQPHPTAGISAIGARGPLIAYNVNLATNELRVAREIAAAVRQSSGGLPSVKAIGVDLADRGIVQVSMNLTNFEVTSIVQAFDAVAREARRRGAEVVESELIGLAPAAALSSAVADHVRLRNFTDDMILENRLDRLGLAI